MILTSASNRKKVSNIQPKIRSAIGAISFFFPPRGFNDPRMWASNDAARKLLAVFSLYLEIRIAVCSSHWSNWFNAMSRGLYV